MSHHASTGNNTTAHDHDERAHRYGSDARRRQPERAWDDELEAELERGWSQARGDSTQEWAHARTAVRDAWHGAERALPDEPDGAAARAAEDAASDDRG